MARVKLLSILAFQGVLGSAFIRLICQVSALFVGSLMNWAGSVAFLALGIVTVVYTALYDRRRRRKPKSDNVVELRFLYQGPLLYLMGSAFIIIGLLGLFGIS